MSHVVQPEANCGPYHPALSLSSRPAEVKSFLLSS
jgi:hypothetical protein